MKNYKLSLEYNGTNFSGSQIQNNSRKRTVQAELEKALQIYFRSPERIKTNFAGRTDAGVHALGQVVNFCLEAISYPDLENNSDKFLISLNGILPNDMSVSQIEEVAIEFNARFHAKARKYSYKIFCRKHRPVLRLDSLHWEKSPLDFNLMETHAKKFLGTHDFRNYCKVQNDYHEANFLCTILESKLIKEQESCFKYEITADRFLRHMVRKIVAELISVGKGLDANLAINTAESFHKDSAPALGLCLVAVDY